MRSYILTKQWEEGFEHLQAYVKLYGNARVPLRYVSPDGFNLGKWVGSQRLNKAKKRLSPDRVKRLETISGWYWDILTEQWEEGFEHLQAYVKLYGNARVGKEYVSPDGLSLWNWVSTQRKQKSKNLLSQDRVKRLETLTGWVWVFFTEQWEEGFEHLQAYVKLYGNARVGREYVSPDGFKLGIWVKSQRSNKSQNLLSQDRIDRLEALTGWVWDLINEKWEEGVEHLQSYVNQDGNARVPDGYVSPDSFKLGSWVSRQRRNKSKSLLSQDQINRLEAFPGWAWNPFMKRWEEAYEQLQAYVKLNGNANVPYKYVTPEGIKLGQWVGDQRKRKSKNLLSRDRVKRLEALQGWVWSFKKETE